jgi:Fe-Mn family superoxide dismutase
MMTRRQALRIAGISALGSLANAPWSNTSAQSPAGSAGTTPRGPFVVPPLPYPFDALEPHIDARTMEIHHDKHHAAYVANLNKAMADFPELAKKPVEDLLRDLNSIPERIRAAIRNQGGGHYNHSLFWRMMKPDGGQPSGQLAKAIDEKFGNFQAFKAEFTKAALGQFGSGWAWLTLFHKGLAIESSPNQDSPVSHGALPLLGIDIWEHAYYLKYQNRRADYISAWFNVINWDYATERFVKGLRET